MSEELNGTLLLERDHDVASSPNIVMTETAVKEPETQSEVYTGAAPEVKNRPVYAFFKRLADFVLSFAASIVLIIPMAVVALAIMIKDPGNPFYIQTRVGKNGKYLRILKFRTMRKGADKLENMLTPEQLDDDPRLIGYKKAGRRQNLFRCKAQAVVDRRASANHLEHLPKRGKRYNRDNQEKRRFFKGCRGLINFVMRFCTGLK